MATYSVSFGVTYFVEAETEDEATGKAVDLVIGDYGRGFWADAWVTDPEVVIGE